MLKNVLGILGFGGEEYDAKILTRDARDMIDMIHGQHGDPSLREIADRTRTQIAVVHKRGLNDPQYYGEGVRELTELNKAARARRDNIAWSGITLAVIYIKAEMLGELGLPARNRIDGFLDKMSTMTPEEAEKAGMEAPLPGTPKMF